MSTQQPWKVGDWCFSEFQLKQIKEVHPERGVSSVTTGTIVSSGWNTFCVPLSLEAKVWSESVEYWEDEIRRKEGGRNLNWPDLHRKFVELWEEGCAGLGTEKAGTMQAHHNKVRDFARGVLDQLETSRSLQADGVPIFR